MFRSRSVAAAPLTHAAPFADTGIASFISAYPGAIASRKRRRARVSLIAVTCVMSLGAGFVMQHQDALALGIDRVLGQSGQAQGSSNGDGSTPASPRQLATLLTEGASGSSPSSTLTRPVMQDTGLPLVHLTSHLKEVMPVAFDTGFPLEPGSLIVADAVCAQPLDHQTVEAVANTAAPCSPGAMVTRQP